jgi:RNA polymerase sigma-70 factor (ECF subfamily)
LIARAQRGDASAFEALVNMHAKLVYNLAFRVVNDPHEAEDLAQEAFLRAWRALPRFRGQARFSIWLYRIVTNLCYNRLPHLRR